MKLKDFIKENKEEIDRYIAKQLHEDKNPIPIYDERRLWILNDEGLYNWAKSEGCKI